MEYEQIKKLMDDMGESKLNAIDVEFPDGTKISMKKEDKAIKKNVEVSVNEIESEDIEHEKTKVEDDTNCNIVKAPMVGTFYSSSAPDKEAFAKVGDSVQKGNTLCIIEAMKLMNEIESEYDGQIEEVFIENGQMVEYGTPLFKIVDRRK